ncbi:MAG: hypothetical protein V1702_02355 [Candidatus Woesearchaeota archaeon]
MRTEQTARGKVTFLSAEDILKYFLGSDDRIDTLIKCKTEGDNIITTDSELYEALGSIQGYDNFKLPALVKFFESVEVNPAQKNILTHERVEELRKLALSGR